MSITKKNIKDIAKASMCISLAGMTAANGAVAPAFAMISDSETSALILNQSEKTIPTTLAQAKEALDAAHAKLAQTAVSKDNAEKAHVATENAYTASKAAYDNNLSAADKAEKDAAAAFDAAVEDARNDVDAAVDATASAKASLDKAVADKASADKAVEDAKAAVESAEKAYSAALASAPDMKPVTEELEAAKAALADAQRLAGEAEAAVENAKSSYDAAAGKLEAAKDELAVANGKNESAQADLALAQHAYDAAVLAKDEADPDEIDSAQAAADQAAEALAAAEQAVQEAADALASAQADYDNADAAERAAAIGYEGAVSALAAIDLAAAEAAVDEAQKNYDAAVEAADAAADDAASAEIALNELASAKESAEKAYAVAKDEADKAAAAVEAASKELENAKSLAENASASVISMYDFFVDMGDAAVLAEFDRKSAGSSLNEINDATHSGSAGDATDYRNVLRALQTIRELNEVRASLGLSELLVCDDLMARGTVSANWSATHLAHSTGCGSENLAWGYDKPVAGWYDTEKKIWDKAVVDGSYNGAALPEGWQDMTAAQLAAKAPDFYSAVGHYLNVIKPSWKFVGAAVNTAEGTYGGIVSEQNYRGYTNSWYGTVDEWESRFMEWVNSKLASDPVADAQAKLNAAVTVLESVKADEADAKSAFNKACAEYSAAETAIESKKAAVEETAAAVEAASKELDAAHAAQAIAENEKVAAEAAVETASKALSAAVAVKSSAAAERDAAAAEARDASDELAVAEDAENDASARLSAVLDKHGKLAADVEFAMSALDFARLAADNAAEGKKAAQAGHDAAVKALDKESAKLSSAFDKSDDAARSLDTASARYEAAAAEYEKHAAAAGKVNDAAHALSAAEGVLAEKEEAMLAAEADIEHCAIVVDEADEVYNKALDKLARAEKLSYIAALDIPVSDPDFAYLNGNVDAVKSARALVEKAEADVAAAEHELALTKKAYEEAYGEWVSAAADVSFYEGYCSDLAESEQDAAGFEPAVEAIFDGISKSGRIPSHARIDEVSLVSNSNVDVPDSAIPLAKTTGIKPDVVADDVKLVPVAKEDANMGAVAGFGLIAALGITATVTAAKVRRRK